MATSLLIGVYDTREDALAARDDLVSEGFERGDIDVLDESGSAAPGEKREKSFWENLTEFFSGPDEDRYYYDEASSRGNTVVRVSCEDHEIDRAHEILSRYNPIDIDERAEQWRKAGWTGQPERKETSEKIPIVEENLNVGKRRETRGGVRIYSRVREQPVSEDVELREEHVRVERHPVDKPADEDAFREQSIEASETREEPIISKESRVVEEVELRKDVDTHTERVEDTVRRTDVEVDQTGGRGAETSTAGKIGEDPAYDFGRQLAIERGEGEIDFAMIEDEARARFQERNLGDWEQHRESVRRGYENVRRAA